LLIHKQLKIIGLHKVNPIFGNSQPVYQEKYRLNSDRAKGQKGIEAVIGEEGFAWIAVLS
jgi:hypothetical protein